MTASIHDHNIVELTISASDRTIRIRTAFPERLGPDFATVLFEDVEAYCFNGDALGTILFEVETTDPMTLYREFANQMQQAYASSGGHAGWVETEATAGEFLLRSNVNGYRLSSSIGLEGAIWARRMAFERN